MGYAAGWGGQQRKTGGVAIARREGARGRAGLRGRGKGAVPRHSDAYTPDVLTITDWPM